MNKLRKENVIYGLIDPNTKEIRYIGKTNNYKRRLLAHHSPSRLKLNTHHNNWIKSLININQKAEIMIIESYDNYEELNQAEIDMIAYLRFIGCKLTNGTLGGDGRYAFNHSEETKKKMSSSAVGKNKGKYIQSNLRKICQLHILDR